MAKKTDQPQWLLNFKKILNQNGMAGEVPKFFVDYFQGYVDQLAAQRNEICTLQEEKREFIRITEDLNRQRAELQIRVDRLETDIKHYELESIPNEI